MEVQQPDRRGARRYELQLVVTLAGVHGESKNFSTTGLYVLTDRSFPVGADIPVEVHFPQLPGNMKQVTGTGRVTRVVPESGCMGVGIELRDWYFA